MNEKIKKHLIAYAEKKGWGTDDKTLSEILIEADIIWKEKFSGHRWYDIYFKVADIDGMKIGFKWYYMTGDNSPSDMDLDFDFESVCEVYEKEKTVKYYTRKAD